MNELEKEIEEMAKSIYESKVALDGTDLAFGLIGDDDHFHRIAIYLYNAGYRNCKDKVVLSNEELNMLIDNIEKSSEIKAEELKQVRKETVREIFAKLRDIGKIITEFDWNDYLKIDVDEFYKLAQQYGVEVE